MGPLSNLAKWSFLFLKATSVALKHIAVKPLILFSSSVTMIKLQIYIYIYIKTYPALCVPCQRRPLWRVSEASRSVYSLPTTCKQLPDTIRTVEVTHDNNCKLWILRDAWTALMFALLWEMAPVCVCWHVLRWLAAFACAYLNRGFTPVAVYSSPRSCWVSAARLLPFSSHVLIKKTIFYIGEVCMQSSYMEMSIFIRPSV